MRRSAKLESALHEFDVHGESRRTFHFCDGSSPPRDTELASSTQASFPGSSPGRPSSSHGQITTQGTRGGASSAVRD